MTYKEAAQMSLDVQDACNLSGVAKSFAGPVMDALWAEARRLENGTEWINRHPIVTLFIDKLASLNRIQYAEPTVFADAFYEVGKIAEGE